MVPTVVLPFVNPSTDQVTAVFAVFNTVAENCCVPPGARVTEFGLMATDTGALPVPDTLMMDVLLNTAPEVSQAFTVRLCWPPLSETLVLSWAAFTVNTLLLSTYRIIAVTGCALSIVPATTWTGDVTVEPFVGVQIVTEGDKVLSAHCAAASAGSASETSAKI